jgi:hypothetical protein
LNDFFTKNCCKVVGWIFSLLPPPPTNVHMLLISTPQVYNGGISPGQKWWQTEISCNQMGKAQHALKLIWNTISKYSHNKCWTLWPCIGPQGWKKDTMEFGKPICKPLGANVRAFINIMTSMF